MTDALSNRSSDADPRQLLLVFATAASVLFLASLGQTVVTTALPTILADLGGIDQLTWVVTAYLMAATVASPVFGKLGDMFGRKVVMQGGIGVFLLGSVICAFASDFWILVGGRFVQGMGGGGLIVSSIAMVADYVPPRERGRYQGILGSVFGLSTIVGPLAGGLIVQHLAWQWIFLLNIPLGVIALAVLMTTPDPAVAPKGGSIDYFGAASLIALLSLVIVSTSLGGQSLPWTSTPMFLIGAGIVLCFWIFIRSEIRAEEPILPLELFRVNNFLVANAVGAITGATMFGTITFVPFFMQVVKGLSPVASGLFVFPMMLGLVGASAFAGAVMSRTGHYRMLPVVSTFFLALGLMGLATMTAHASNAWVLALMVTVGVGIGPVIGVGITAIQNAMPQNLIGVGTASASMFRLIGGSVGTAAFGAIFVARLNDILTEQAISLNARGISLTVIEAMEPELRETVRASIAAAMHPVFWIGAILALLACAISLMMVELPLRDQATKPQAAE